MDKIEELSIEDVAKEIGLRDLQILQLHRVIEQLKKDLLAIQAQRQRDHPYIAVVEAAGGEQDSKA